MASRYTDKTSITQKEYVQLIGLRTLAEHHQRYLKDIATCIQAIVAEKDDMGHSGDCAWGDVDVDHLLANLAITVEKPTTELRSEGTNEHD